MRNITKKLYLLLSAVCVLPALSDLTQLRGQPKAPPENNAQEEIKRLQEEVKELGDKVGELTSKLEGTSVPEGDAEPYKTSFLGTFGNVMNPDISGILNAQALFTDDRENDNRNKVRIPEAELALQGYLYPGIRADLIAAFEQEYEGSSVETHVDLEEGYVSFLDLPWGFTALGGRKLLDFGQLNRQHPHHWPFADTPAVLGNFLGNHSWFDDGGQVSYLVPNPFETYLTFTFGVWNGRELGHHHHGEEEHEEEEHEEEEHEEEEHHEHEEGAHGHEPLDWNGHVYLARVYANRFLDDDESMDLGLGYSLAWDEGYTTKLHGLDVAFRYTWPESYHRLKLQAELYYVDTHVVEHDDPRLAIQSLGAYVLGQYTWNKYWELGTRYDWSRYADNDEDHMWAITPFVSYFFTHSTYARLQYRFRENLADEIKDDHAVMIQFVWGLGPHAHRIEE